MDKITSTKNQYVKLARSLFEKKFRNASGLFLVEGINVLRDMPGSVCVEHLFFSEARQDEALALVKSKMAEEGNFSYARANVACVSDAVLSYITDTVSPYGIVAVCKMMDNTFALVEGHSILVDGVQDPGNLGTIIRTAAACDFKNVYLLDTVDLYSPKVVRSTLGAMFRLNVCQVSMDDVKKSLAPNCEICVLDMSGESLLDATIPDGAILVCGNEAHGVRDELKNLAKHTYSLPMKNGIESLNVAVASAVAMYQTLK